MGKLSPFRAYIRATMEESVRKRAVWRNSLLQKFGLIDSQRNLILFLLHIISVLLLNSSILTTVISKSACVKTNSSYRNTLVWIFGGQRYTYKKTHSDARALTSTHAPPYTHSHVCLCMGVCVCLACLTINTSISEIYRPCFVFSAHIWYTFAH